MQNRRVTHLFAFFTPIYAPFAQSFAENRIALLTEKIPNCIDHIAVSARLVSGAKLQIEEWNMDKRLSDHKGIAVGFA